MATSGVSSSSSTGGMFTSTLRIGGLATGLNTDELVSSLMKAERIPLDKIYQKKQLAEWKRDAYREITNSLVGFKNDYFNLLKSSSNMLSRSTYKKFSISVIDSALATTSTTVSATANSDATPGTHTITVNKMASADTAESTVSFSSAPVTGTVDLSGKNFRISLDGGTTYYDIQFGAGKTYTSVQDMAKDLQELIDANSNLKGKVAASYGSSNNLVISGIGSTTSLTLAAGADDALAAVGIILAGGLPSETRTYQGVTADLKSAGDITDVAALNGKKFNLTLDGVTKEITIGTNADMDALVTDLNNKIGAAFGNNKIIVSKTGDNLKQLKFDTVENSGVNKITLSSGTSPDDGLSLMGFSSGDSNRLSTGMTLEKLANKFAVPLNFVGGTNAVTSSDAITNTSWKGKTFNLTVDGQTRAITFTTDPTSDSLASTLQNLIDGQFGAGAVTVSMGADNKLTFTKGTAGYFSFSSSTSNDALADLKIETGTTTSGQLKFNINGKDFSFSATQTLANMMSAINSDSTAKVRMSYDESADKFRIVSNQLGVGDNIKITENPLTGGNFFDGASGISTVNTVTSRGVDASVIVDGQQMTRSSNTFTVNGISYTLLNERPGVQQSVSISLDVDGIYNNIKNFVDKYNEIIDKINTKLSEKYDRDYPPLTSEQKDAMSDDDIKKWEEKAKTGLLSNDSILDKIVTDMRRALSDPISGESTVLFGIGITTGSYLDKGKLEIDETKLKAAIQNNPDGVANLFSKQSSTFPTYSRSASASQRATRYSEEGLMQRISDILEDNISTYRDNNGNKGVLLEKAGLVGDASEFDNLLYDEINQYTEKANDLTERLAEKEENYYKKFTNLEVFINQMNQQSSWLSSQLSQN
ncbi:MAG: flagellar filament capping protein FliD [Clostridiales bacterium]|jgi:flagellar hook-associated protein 2|nr:flagellar filament capping protein FliD [Eubacteriales bacterium]MDH7566152.1 flagellar filament capping protein FliD [Clostridiales bacterium]